MDSIFDMLSGQLGGSMLDQLSGQLGGNRDATNSAITAALPAIIGALAKNASKPGGADALANALDRDHDGSVLEDLGGFLNKGGNVKDGDGILKHVFGERRPQVEQAISKNSGLDMSAIGKLLPMLAPIVLGALGKAKKEKSLDSGGLGDLLGLEKKRVQEAAPQLDGLLGMLDLDKDGSVADEVMGFGAKILGGLFRKR